MITMATFSLVPLSMESLVEILLECENCQRRFVVETLIHADLVKRSLKDPDLGSLRVSFQGGSQFIARNHGQSLQGHI